jgi:hypothetical protein
MSSRTTLAALLRDRSRSDRARFVAALYAARGATTRVEGNVVVADGERIAVAGGRAAVLGRLPVSWPGTGAGTTPRGRVDRVVAVDPDRAARLAARADASPLSAADLDRLARYGLDREAADAVFREQFGRPVAAVDPPASPATASRTPSRTTPGSAALRPGLALLVGVALLGVVLGAAGGPGATLPWAWDASESVSTAASEPVTPASTAADTATDGEAGAGDGTTTAHTWAGANDTRAGAAGFAPGVSGGRLADVDALAEAHAAALANRSYRWELEYVESSSGIVTARGTEVVRVDSRREFVSRVQWQGRPVGFSPVASQSTYANGTARHQPATGGGVVAHAITDVPPAGEQGWRAARYLRWYLRTAESTVERTLVRGGTPTAVVRASGTTYPNAEEYTVRAHVTDEGFVRSLSVSYRLAARGDSPAVAVRFSFRYLLDDDVAVSPPAWYTAGVNATGGGNGTATPTPAAAGSTTTPRGSPTATPTTTPADG